MDLENEFSGEPYEQKSESNTKTQIENDLDDETTEDPALVEKVAFYHDIDRTMNISTLKTGSVPSI